MHRKLDSHLFQARTGQDMKVVCAQTSSKFLIPMVPQAQRTQSPLRTPFHSKPNNATMATLDVTVRESPATGPDNAKVANPGVTVHQHTLRDVASPATGPLMAFSSNLPSKMETTLMCYGRRITMSCGRFAVNSFLNLVSLTLHPSRLKPANQNRTAASLMNARKMRRKP